MHNPSFCVSSSVANIRLPAKRWHLKQTGVVRQNKLDAENVVHLSTFCQGIVSEDIKIVLNEYHQNCRYFPGSIITSGLTNGYPKTFL